MTEYRVDRTDEPRGWGDTRTALVEAATVEGVGPEPEAVEGFARVLAELDDGVDDPDGARSRLAYVLDRHDPDHVATFGALAEGDVSARETVLRAGVASDPGETDLDDVLAAAGLDVSEPTDRTLGETLAAAGEDLTEADRIDRSVGAVLDDAGVDTSTVLGGEPRWDADVDTSAGVLFSAAGVLDGVDAAAGPVVRARSRLKAGMPDGSRADAVAGAVYDAHGTVGGRRVERAARELAHEQGVEEEPVEPVVATAHETFCEQLARSPTFDVTEDEVAVATRLTLERPAGVEPVFPNPHTGNAPPMDTVESVFAAADEALDGGVDARPDGFWVDDTEQAGLVDALESGAGEPTANHHRDGLGFDTS